MIEEVESLGSMSLDELRRIWKEVAPRHDPPRSRYRLYRELAWIVQVRRSGDFDAETKHQLEAAVRASSRSKSEGPENLRRKTSPDRTSMLRPGTRLVRSWHGRDYEVTLRDDGRFDLNGVTYATLSEAARAITGTRWSGPRFFGLVRRASGVMR